MREEARDRGRQIEKKTKTPFQSFWVTAYSADIIKVRRNSTKLGEFPCYCHLLPPLKGSKWLTFSVFSCADIRWSQRVRPWLPTLSQSVTDYAFIQWFFYLKITRLEASISPSLPFPCCCIIDCAPKRPQSWTILEFLQVLHQCQSNKLLEWIDMMRWCVYEPVMMIDVIKKDHLVVSCITKRFENASSLPPSNESFLQCLQMHHCPKVEINLYHHTIKQLEWYSLCGFPVLSFIFW